MIHDLRAQREGPGPKWEGYARGALKIPLGNEMWSCTSIKADGDSGNMQNADLRSPLQCQQEQKFQVCELEVDLVN